MASKWGGKRPNAGRTAGSRLGWQEAFKHLKHDYIRLNLFLLEVADAEEVTAERDRIYDFVKRSAFMHEVLALKEAGKRAEDM